MAEFGLPAETQLGRYSIKEVWVETTKDVSVNQIVVRLSGPHVDHEPRAPIVGFDPSDYLGIWSERNGPPYEAWVAPTPLPNELVFQKDAATVVVTLIEDDQYGRSDNIP